MHELSITQNIVGIVAERAQGRRVTKVTLRIGRLSGIETRAVEFCFDICAQGTPVEGAELEIEEVEAAGQCRGCDREVPLEHLVAVCPCDRRAPLQIVRGEELLVKAMEVETCAESADVQTATP
ncbi:MAG: hydrogenase maturation nickel metallochaperone HypA [Myxococcota bacterium]